MTEYNQNRKMHAAEDKVIKITVKDVADLAGGNGNWKLSKYEGGPNVLEKNTMGGGITFTDNVMEITLESADTENLTPGRYHHEAAVSDSQNDVNVVAEGEFRILDRLKPIYNG